MSDQDVKQRLAAILAADVAGYSRLMGDDERATIATLDAYRAVFRAHIEANGGRIVDMAGDSVLAIFDSATGAVKTAVDTQASSRVPWCSWRAGGGVRGSTGILVVRHGPVSAGPRGAFRGWCWRC